MTLLAMLEQQDKIEAFIAGIKKYFAHISNEEDLLEIGTPYLIKGRKVEHGEYTGIISISGASKGVVLFSAHVLLLKYLLLRHEETQLTVPYLRDMVGEISNTIAGNTREHLGENFIISTPKVIDEAIDVNRIDNHQHAYVLPIKWCNNQAWLIVSLEQG